MDQGLPPPTRLIAWATALFTFGIRPCTVVRKYWPSMRARCCPGKSTSKDFDAVGLARSKTTCVSIGRTGSLFGRAKFANVDLVFSYQLPERASILAGCSRGFANIAIA